MKQMARRPLVEWPDHSYYLDYTPSERFKVVKGWLIALGIVLAFIFAPLAIGAVALSWFGL